MDPSSHSDWTTADEKASRDPESRTSSGSETEKGSPTTNATDTGSEVADKEYHLVYARQFRAPNDPEALRLSRGFLKGAVSNDELFVRPSGDCRVVTNTEGFEYRWGHSPNNGKMALGKDLKSAMYNGYIEIRRRFMAAYERKCKGEDHITEIEHSMIMTGNQRAHGGDCLLDAFVLQFPGGPGEDTYKRLYGLAPDKVEEISKFRTESLGTYTYQDASAHNGIIDELNQHATAVANGRREVSPDYLIAFDKFIAALEKEGITPGSDLSPGVRAAYDALKEPQVYEPNARSSCSKKRKREGLDWRGH